MKNILKMLAILSITTPLSINVAACSNHGEESISIAKITDLEKKLNKEIFNKSFINLSDTTGIFIENETHQAYYFDSTKVNQSSKGFIALEMKVKENKFIRLSNTKGIVIQKETNKAYLFDSTKVNEETKRFIDLEVEINDFYRLSDTTGILQETTTNKAYLFDSSKVNDKAKGLVNLDKKLKFTGLAFPTFLRLSQTTGIFASYNDDGSNSKLYYFDSTKIDESSKGFIDLELNFSTYRDFSGLFFLSDNMAIIHSLSDKAYLFDSTKVNESSKGLIDLEKNILDYLFLSNTDGLFQEIKTDKLYYFDSTRVNESSKGFIDLEINLKENKFIRLSNTKGIVIQKETNKAYLFDSTKVNESSKGLINLETIAEEFYILSQTSGIFVDVTNKTFFFNLVENKLIVDDLKVNITDFYRINDKAGILQETDTNKAYYFDSTKINLK